jgi:dienelactone hydrolase
VAEVVLFHHVQGLTDGVRAFAEQLRAGGHTVHTPDLFGGETAPSIREGLDLVKRTGGERLDQRIEQALHGLPQDLVYAGFSFGGATAQELAQTRPGARGALLYESFVSLTAEWTFGPWPKSVKAQIHGMEHDPFFADEGDLAAAREFAAAADPGVAEVFTYPGDKHLFTDSSLPSYDPEATKLVLDRSITFLNGLS